MIDLDFSDYSEDMDAFCTDRESFFLAKADTNVSDDVLGSLQPKKRERILCDVKNVAEICGSLFGRAPVRVDPLERQGTFHLLYKIVFSGAESYICRVPLPIFPYHAWDLYIDKWIVGKLLRGRVPCPDVYDVDLSRDLCPFEYEILGEAKGCSLSDANINLPTMKNLMFELGQVVAKVHSIRTSGFGLLDIRRILSDQEPRGLHQTWEAYIFLNLERHVKICCDIAAINHEEATRIRSVFEQTRHVLKHVTPSLLHGDLGNHNIFSDGQHISAIIDWEDCMSGDMLFDVASWGTFYGNDNWRERFLTGYSSLLSLPKDSELRYWLYYLRVALAKTVHRYRFRYEDHLQGPPSSHRIQKSLQKVESIMRKGDF
jgi:fructosamine-3-kinase